MTQEVVNEYPAERLKEFRGQLSAAEAAIKKLRDVAYGDREIKVTLTDLTDIEGALDVTVDLAYDLDEGMSALNYYASESTWIEVPEKTLAAEDRGMKARVALARINPI